MHRPYYLLEGLFCDRFETYPYSSDIYGSKNCDVHNVQVLASVDAITIVMEAFVSFIRFKHFFICVIYILDLSCSSIRFLGLLIVKKHLFMFE